MTLYLAFELIEQGRLSYQTKIKISANAAAAAPTKLDLAEEEIALIDAIKALITKSANDVAVAIAEHIAGSEEKFAKLMTQKARQLGMPATLFSNASGLPDDEQVTTARDMVTLALRSAGRFPQALPALRHAHLHLQRRNAPQSQHPAVQLRGYGRDQDRLYACVRVQPRRLRPPRPQARRGRHLRRRQRRVAQRRDAHLPEHGPGEGLQREDASGRSAPGGAGQACAGPQDWGRADAASRRAPAATPQIVTAAAAPTPWTRPPSSQHPSRSARRPSRWRACAPSWSRRAPPIRPLNHCRCAGRRHPASRTCWRGRIKP